MYILYKNPIQLDTLSIVQYLHYKGILFLPNCIIERNYPPSVTQLPTIYYKNQYYCGINECIELYENISGIDNILEKARKFIPMKN